MAGDSAKTLGRARKRAASINRGFGLKSNARNIKNPMAGGQRPRRAKNPPAVSGAGSSTTGPMAVGRRPKRAR